MKNSTEEQFNEEIIRLFECKTISDCNCLFDIYLEFLLKAIINHSHEPINSQADDDAKIVLQMMMTKMLYLKNTLLGITFKLNDGTILEKIIDPTIVASLVRNIYETTGMFNLIYRQTKNEDEKTIIYSLWVHAGLKFRQRFESIITTIDGREKYESEKIMMDNIVAEIEATSLFQKLDLKNKAKIKTKLKEKDYLLKFEGGEVIFLYWKDLVKSMGIQENHLEHIYTNLSFYSHPSNVSVFQFKDMFIKGEEAFIELTLSYMQIAFSMISIFIADYINLFPSVYNTYKSMDSRDKIVVNLHNTMLRGSKYSLIT